MKKTLFLYICLFILFPSITYSISSRVLGDINYDDKVSLEEAIYALQVSAGLKPQSDAEYTAMYTAIGTYTFDSTTLRANFTNSNFPENIGVDIGVSIFNISLISDTNMTWTDEDDNEMTWTRKSGTVGDIVGPWEFYDEESQRTYMLYFKSDQSLSLKGYLASYEKYYIVTYKTITIDGNIDDWNDIEPIFLDDVDDQNPDANFDGTDLHKFYLAKDETFLYIGMTLYDGNPKMDIFTQYGFQANHSPKRGDSPGDNLAKAGFRDNNWYAGVHLRCSSASSDIATYPSSYVGIGTKFIEWKVLLSDMEEINGKYVRVYIHTFENSSNPEYPVSDENITEIRLIVNN